MGGWILNLGFAGEDFTGATAAASTGLLLLGCGSVLHYLLLFV